MNSLKLILTRSKYFGPAFVFASLNVVFGTWAIYIPVIKTRLHISEGKLGLAIFFMALGTLMLIALAPRIINKIGVGKTTFMGIILFMLSFIIAFSANTFVMLCFGLFVVGAFAGITDVAMNALVSYIEKRDAVHIMSANHGFFSIGGFLGAGLGGFFLNETIVPTIHLLVVVGVLIVVNIIVVSNYIQLSSEKLEKTTMNFQALKPVIILGVVAFFIMSTEGAIVDWSALYLEQVVLLELSKVGLGYAIFSGAMAIGRFFGDEVSQYFGSKMLVLFGLSIAFFGFVLILTAIPALAFMGFGLVGLGLSGVIPELFRMATKKTEIEASIAISFVSGIGFLGFLVGPVLLGFLAELYNLKFSFIALMGFVALSFFVAFRIK